MSNQTELPIKNWNEYTPKERRLIAKRELEAAKNGDRERARQTPKGGFALKGYLRCDMAASDKLAFKEWEDAQSAEAVGASVVALADSGYLVKLGESGQGYQASLCAATTGKAWEGYVLTAHASSAVRAAAALIYKHAVMMESDWSAWLEEDNEDFLR